MANSRCRRATVARANAVLPEDSPASPANVTAGDYRDRIESTMATERPSASRGEAGKPRTRRSPAKKTTVVRDTPGNVLKADSSLERVLARSEGATRDLVAVPPAVHPTTPVVDDSAIRLGDVD